MKDVEGDGTDHPIKVPAAALTDIAAERERQKSVEGWTPEHDDNHRNGEMAYAAAKYISPVINPWPFERKWWKPKTRRYDLVRAAALIVAEIERLDRAASRG